jgi:integrase
MVAPEPSTALSPPLGFTPAWIASFTPPAGTDRLELGDKHPRGRGLRIRFERKGPPTFRWKATDGKARRNVQIGPWALAGKPGHITLAQAREWLRRLKEAAQAGRLAEIEAELKAWLAEGTEEAKRSRDAAPAGRTVKDVAEEWYQRRILPVRTDPGSVRRTLDKDILPAVGARVFTEVDELDLGRIVDAVVDRGARTYAGTVLSHAKQLWRWAQGRGYLKADGVRLANPAAALEAASFRVRKGKRARFATDTELRQLWTRLEKPLKGFRTMDPVLSLALRLLVLTGVRSGELRRATWIEIDWDEATWTIPPDHQKLKPGQLRVPWVVPLVPAAVALLRELQELAGESPFVLPSPGHTPAKAGCVNKGSLPRAMAALFAAPEGAQLDAGDGERLRPHDLRRTVRTGLARLGVRHEVAERCLNHAVQGMEAIYNQHDFLEERREALQRWAVHVQEVVHGPPPKQAPKLRAVK